MSDFQAPLTQADLDSLTAADVGRLEDADLAAAFARLVAGDELKLTEFGLKPLWWLNGTSRFAEDVYGFTLATVDAIRKRGWGYEIFGGPEYSNAIVLRENRQSVPRRMHADPARALMSAAVLAAIAERDAG